MDANVLWKRTELPFQVLAEETIVVHPRTHEVHVLNETGSRLWELLAREWTLGDLVAQVEDEFDGPADEVRREVLRFLDELCSKRLIVSAGRAGSGDERL